MNEHDEKWEEKGVQKHEEKMAEEKSPEEKSYEEKYRRDPLGTLVWAVVLIWAGAVMLANNFGLLKGLQNRLSDLPFDFLSLGDGWSLAWSLFFLGAGVILLVEVLIRLTVPEYRRPVTGTFILAVVFFGIGLGSWQLIWPLVLIVIGASILLRGMFRSRE